MKKLLLVVAMLLLAMPVMAATTITAVNEGAVWTAPDGNKVQTVRIDYTSTVDVRAFALDISISDANGNSPNFQYIRGFKTGESNATSPGYGIFPSRFRDFIAPTNPVWTDANYNPTAAWNEPDTISPRTGLGFTKMTVELGTLFAGDANKPALSGTLFRFDVNAWGQTGTFHLTVAANATRGGVVGADANAIAGVSYVGSTIVFAGSTCPAEPNVAGMSRSAAVAALTGQGFIIGADVNVPPTATYATVRTVTTQNPPAGTTGCGTTVNLSVVSYPVKDAAPNSMYANWVTLGRPQCWGYPRQCRGDADGKKQISYWVASNDLAIFKTAVSKATLPPGGACADFDHKKQISYWVASNDLVIFKKYVSKAETSVPICGSVPSVPSADANFWYYCVPTGVTCPAGQICAPAGICPNTP